MEVCLSVADYVGITERNSSQIYVSINEHNGSVQEDSGLA